MDPWCCDIYDEPSSHQDFMNRGIGELEGWALFDQKGSRKGYRMCYKKKLRDALDRGEEEQVLTS